FEVGEVATFRLLGSNVQPSVHDHRCEGARALGASRNYALSRRLRSSDQVLDRPGRFRAIDEERLLAGPVRAFPHFVFGIAWPGDPIRPAFRPPWAVPPVTCGLVLTTWAACERHCRDEHRPGGRFDCIGPALPPEPRSSPLAYSLVVAAR